MIDYTLVQFPILFCKCENSAPSPINLHWITLKNSGKRKIPRHDETKTEIFSQNLEPGELQTLPQWSMVVVSSCSEAVSQQEWHGDWLKLRQKIKPSTAFLEKHAASLFACVWNNFIGKGEEPAQFQMCKARRDLCKKAWAQGSQRRYTKFQFQFLKILRVCFYFVGKAE